VGRAGSLAATEYQYQKIDVDLTDYCRHLNGESTIANKANRYAPEFRRQMVELVRTGRTPSELSREFGPTSSTLAHWAKQAERNAVRSDRGLTTVE
jgi:transposase-like protein